MYTYAQSLFVHADSNQCDQRKPGCERCERTGRECEGYARGTIFLNQTGFASAAHERSRLNHNPQEGGARIQIFAATPETYNKRKKRQDSTDTKDEETSASPAFSAGSSISTSSSFSLQTTALSRQLENLCLDRLCPIKSQQACFSLSMIAPEMLASSNQEPTFHHAFNALKLSMPYKHKADTDMIIRSRIEYGKALREMQTAIADAPTHISDQTLLACTVLKQYEVCRPSNRYILR